MKPLHVKKSTNVIISGVALSLFALVILLSHGTPFEFLNIAICASFGFIGFWILTPFLLILGLYIAFRKKLIQFKLGLSLWGIFIVVLSLMVITSNWGASETITFSNSVALLKQNAPFDPFNNPNIGGGFFGYVLAGILNNAITSLGTTILCWILFSTGVILIFNKQISLLFKKIRHEQSEKKDVEHVDVQVIEESEPQFRPQENESIPEEKREQDKEMIQSMVATSFNSTHGFQKAIFCIEQKNQQKVEPSSFSANSFAQEEPPVEESVPEIHSSFEKSTFSYENEPATSTVDKEETEVVNTPVEPVEEDYSNLDFTQRPQPKAKVHPPYSYPKNDLLESHEKEDDYLKNDESTAQRTDLLTRIFNDLNIGATVVGHTIGPSVTRYDIQMNANCSSRVFDRYLNDISSRLNGVSVRFQPVVADRSTSGLEVPNKVRVTVGLLESIKIMEAKECNRMDIIFGKNVSGELLTANLTKFPHMLVAGTTGSGKSIFMHATILTLIMRNSPDELKLILIDPKKVEMNCYEDIPHLLCPNVSEPRQAYIALEKLCQEMERRYNLFKASRVREISEFNAYAKANGIKPLPFIVVFVDEYADLSEACKEIRAPVVRIAQKARSAGIHLVIATQRPSVNVIDGVIKANVPVHVALMTSNSVDSSIIVNEAGAEKLLGNGDMLVECSLISRGEKPRVQGCFVSTNEINNVCDFLRSQGGPQYDPYFLDLEHDPKDVQAAKNEPEVTKVDKNMAEDELYEQIKEDISKREYCSISFLTRSYAIGFPKAGRLFQKLINDGYVASNGDARGSKVLKRQVVHQEQQIGSFEQSEFIPNSQLDDEPEESIEDQNFENYPVNE